MRMKTGLASRWGLLAAALVLVCAGCVKKAVNGESLTYSFDIWVLPTIVLSSLVAIPIGYLLRKKVARLGWALMILGPFGLLMSPTFMSDYAKVDADHFETSYGFWFAPSKYNVRFDELANIELETVIGRGRRGSKTRSHYMNLNYKSGKTSRVALGTVMKPASNEILQRAEAKGVPVTGALDEG